MAFGLFIYYIIGYNLDLSIEHYITYNMFLFCYNSEMNLFDLTLNHMQGGLSFCKLELKLDISCISINSLTSSFLIEYIVLMDGNPNQGFSGYGVPEPNFPGGNTPQGGGSDPLVLPNQDSPRFGDEDVTYAKNKNIEYYPEDPDYTPINHLSKDNYLKTLRSMGVSKPYYFYFNYLVNINTQLLEIDPKGVSFLDPFKNGKPSGFYYLSPTGLPQPYHINYTFHNDPLELFRLHRYGVSDHLY